jgi:antitoxin ParD1/3/4
MPRHEMSYIDNLWPQRMQLRDRIKLPMNVSLTPELEKFVSTKVGSGRYNSASEVVREALRLLEEHDRNRAAQLAEFNQELGRRLASLDRGESVAPSVSRARLTSKSEQRRKSG